MNVKIRPHEAKDRPAIRRVHIEAFGQPLESKLVNALIDGGYARISLVAEMDGVVVGHILFSPLQITVGAEDVAMELTSVALAPVAVSPDWQNRGIGSELIRHGLDRCSALGDTSVFVLGDPAYYGRFGFSAELAARFESTCACEAFQALELQSGALPASGTVRYAPPFVKL
jgi:putative acetyltransferase